MQYQVEIDKQTKREKRQTLIDLWLECKTLEEFCVKAETRCNASKFDVWKFKTYHFKKLHLFLYAIMHLGACPAIVGLLCLVVPISHLKNVIFGVILYMLGEIAWSDVVSSLFQSIDWHEHGCPVDY